MNKLSNMLTSNLDATLLNINIDTLVYQLEFLAAGLTAYESQISVTFILRACRFYVRAQIYRTLWNADASHQFHQFFKIGSSCRLANQLLSHKGDNCQRVAALAIKHILTSSFWWWKYRKDIIIFQLMSSWGVFVFIWQIESFMSTSYMDWNCHLIICEFLMF